MRRNADIGDYLKPIREKPYQAYLSNALQVADILDWVLKHSKVFKDFGTVDTSLDIKLAAGPVIPCGKSRDMHEACFDWIATKLESWNLPTNREK